MSRIIAYDLCRLFIGPHFATPRGIDRVDLAMAKHIFCRSKQPAVDMTEAAYCADLIAFLGSVTSKSHNARMGAAGGVH